MAPSSPASLCRAACRLTKRGIGRRLEPLQLALEAVQLQRADRVDRARAQPRVLARRAASRPPARRSRAARRRAGSRARSGSRRSPGCRAAAPARRRRSGFSMLSRNSSALARTVGLVEAHADVRIVQSGALEQQRHQPEYPLELLLHRLPQRLEQPDVVLLELLAQRPEHLVRAVMPGDLRRQERAR